LLKEATVGTSTAELTGRADWILLLATEVRLVSVSAIRSANSAVGSAGEISSIALAARSGITTRGTAERVAGLRIIDDFSRSRDASRPAVTAISCGVGDRVSAFLTRAGRTTSADTVGSGMLSDCGASTGVGGVFASARDNSDNASLMLASEGSVDALGEATSGTSTF
jgi:hypothetical protein